MGSSVSVINSSDSPTLSMTPSGITITGSTKKYNTYADMKADKNPPNYAYVIDASGDPTVGSGGAIYRYTSTGWKKMYEEESMDQDILVEDVTTTINKYLVPSWIPVPRNEGEAVFDVVTSLGNYYSIRITDADVEEFGNVFDINFLSSVVGATYTNTIPLNKDNAFIIVDVAIDSPSKNVSVRVDGTLYSTPNRFDIYWNGTKAVIDPKSKQIVKLTEKIKELQNEITAIRTETANIETVFVNDGTDEHPAEVALVDDEWCVMTSPFIATLPADAKDGDSIHMSIEHGSVNMVVIAPAGTTINGQAKPCLVGVDELGQSISNVSFYFVYNAARYNWIVL